MDGAHTFGDPALMALFSASPGLRSCISRLPIAANGDVRVSYQDQTAGTLRWAVRDHGSGAWSTSVLTAPSFAGAFSAILDGQPKPTVLSFWRQGGAKVAGDVAASTTP